MLKKILRITAKSIIGIFLFYLFLGSVVIPLAVKWGGEIQGAKILKTPVRIRAVFFNPFLWRLNIRGFEILDAGKQVLVGFDKLAVDVSFTNLLKKVCRIESISLDGLKLNVVLLPDGRMNLLDLVPPQGGPATPSSSISGHKVESQPPAAVVSASGPASPASVMPLVIIDRITLTRGMIHFTDRSIQPSFSTVLNDMMLEITSLSTRPEDEAKILFKAKLDQKGKISLETMGKPLKQPLAMEASFKLNDYAMQVLSPYVGKYTGRALGDGKLDIRMDYRIGDNKITAGHKLLIQNFKFGQKVESKDALPLPFGLAVALLEDPQGKINISLPVNGDMNDPKFEYLPLLGKVVRNFFLKLVTKPFSILASVVGGSGAGGTEELDYVKFLPGTAELPEEEKQKISMLAKGLNERPRLLLEINGTFDPQVDWKAIQSSAFVKDFEELMADSSRSPMATYQLLFQRRFGIRSLWTLTKKYKSGIGKYDDFKVKLEIKRQLIEAAPPDTKALSVLGQDRAQRVHDLLVSSGFDARRLKIGPVRSTQSSMGYVPLEFTLTVFENQK